MGADTRAAGQGASHAAQVAGCEASGNIEDFANRFASAVIEARQTQTFAALDGCLDGVPDIYTGDAPNCWDPCDATRVFGTPDGGLLNPGLASEFWSTRLSVTYDVGGEMIDVIERWEIRVVDARFDVGVFEIDEPVVSRAASAEIISDYLGAIEREDWAAAAQLLLANDAPLSERSDLQQLQPREFTVEGIAVALERWCSASCDTRAPASSELTFNGERYVLERDQQTILASFFEGTFSIAGAPLRSDQPDTSSELPESS